jgi:NAD(P)-dependent dehydrogenase (short-subunit alcohol dehydrogenase family)
MKKSASQGVFITGGCGDIGRAVAARFVAAGGRVVLADLLPEAAGRKVAEGFGPGKALYVRCDTTKSSSVARALKKALAFLGRLDAAICNAGMVQNQPFLEVTEEAWNRTMKVNLTGSFIVSQQAARIMVRNTPRGLNRRGAILFTGSWVQDMPWPEGSSYASSKGGQQMLMKIIAQEMAPKGITANIVAPGFVYAGLTKKIYDTQATFRRRVSVTIPLKRMSSADEVAGAFVFLAGDDGAYITGTTLLIDGGASLVRRD